MPMQMAPHSRAMSLDAAMMMPFPGLTYRRNLAFTMITKHHYSVVLLCYKHKPRETSSSGALLQEVCRLIDSYPCE